MGRESSPDESEIPAVVGRRSARLSVIVPITVHGTDTAGHAFKENTWTISVNKHGARLAAFHQVAAGDMIVVENPLLGGTGKARVIRVCEKRFPEDPYEICVELLEAQNVWGVKAPPEDWQKRRPIVLGNQKSPTPHVAPQSPETSAASAGKIGNGETVHLPPQGSPAEVEHTGGLSQFNMAVSALSRFAGEAAAAPSQPATHEQSGRRDTEALVRQSETPDSLALVSLQKKINEAQSLRQELSALVDQVQSARAEVENLLLKGQESRRDWTFEAEQVAKKIAEASDKTLQSAFERLEKEVEHRLEPASTRLEGETLQRLQAETAGIGENVSKQVGDRLSALAQESLSKVTVQFQGQCDQAAEQARAELDELVKDATTVVDARIGKVMKEISPALNAQIEGSAERAAHERLEEFKKQIESVRKSSEDSARQNLERMRLETQAEILNAANQARKIYKEESETAAKAISVCVDSGADSLNLAGDEAAAKMQATRQTLELSLKKAAEEQLIQLAGESASMLEKFRAETQALAAHLQSQVESTAREFSEKASRGISEKLEATVEGALERSAREFNQQAQDALAILKEGLRSAQEQCLDEARKQLAGASESTSASLTHEAVAKSASFRDQLHGMLLEMQDLQTKEMETKFQTGLQGLLESLRTQIQLETNESAARATAEIRSRTEQVLQELTDRLYKGVGMAALVVKEWEDQARTRLETHLRQALGVFQKQLEELTMAAQERQRSEAEALAGLLRSRLHQATRLFEGLESDASQSKEAARDESGNSAFQSLQQPRDAPRPVLEPLVEKQQRIIEQALEAFRSMLSQILADHTPKE